MLRRLLGSPLFLVVVGAACLSANGNSDNRSIRNPVIRPGTSQELIQPEGALRRREQIGQVNYGPPYQPTGHFRMGNWDYRENWRYSRDAFYRGETQPQAYREEHPYGPAGVGFDADINYYRNVRRLRDFYQRHPTAANRARLENYVNPYHERPYRGNYGEGSYNDAYGNGGRRMEYNPSSGQYYSQ